MSEPLLSIGFPVFNGEAHLRQALDSLLAQQFGDFELIISDNGSTDATSQICRDYSAKDQRIKYHHNATNQGPVWNFNNVFQLASAEYFMWASHDDYWNPLYLKTCMEEFDRSDAVILSGTACDSIDTNTTKLKLTDYGVMTIGLKPAERFRKYKQILHTGKHIGGIFYGIYRREFLAKVMPLRNILCADHLLLAELSLSGEFSTNDKRLMKKGSGTSSVNLKNIVKAMGGGNPFLVHTVYLTREIILQKIIFISGRLTYLEKFRLSCWSMGNYLFLCFRLRYRALRDFLKSMPGENHQRLSGQG